MLQSLPTQIKTNPSIKTAVIPAAGMGTRMLPMTKAVPKELLPVYDRPIIQHVVEEALEAGIEKIIIVDGPNKEGIRAHFEAQASLQAALEKSGKVAQLKSLEHTADLASRISYVRQDQPLGLGHAILQAEPLIGADEEAFAVILPDDLMIGGSNALADMKKTWGSFGGGHILGLQEVPADQTGKYGIVEPEMQLGDDFVLASVVEKPSPAVAPSNLAVIGRYILDRCIFDDLSAGQVGHGGEIQLTDSIERTAHAVGLSGRRLNTQRFDCGSPQGWLSAQNAMAKHVSQKLYKTAKISVAA